jgi:predicted ester cyclase
MKRSLNLLMTAAFGLMMFSACAKNDNQAANGAVDSAKMTAEANKEKMKAFYENVINAHNADKVSDYATASFVDHNPDPGHDGNGLENNVKNFKDWFTMMPDAHIAIDNMVADGDMVWTMVTMTGTWKGDMGPMKATGKSCKVGGVDIVRIKDGKASERWGYFDNMAMMQQLGMPPMPPPPAPASAKKM